MTHAPTAAELESLAAIYRDADELFSGWSCPASTECCRFGITGREPYVTAIELRALERAAAARGARPKTAGSRRLPTVTDTERRCPMLGDGGRCSVYAWRPLGCRTFWCDRASEAGKVRQTEVNALVRRVKDVAARYEAGGDQGRPLTRALR